jgi:hypothetical protein
LGKFQRAHGRARRKARKTFQAGLKTMILKAGLKTRWFEVV